MFRLEESASGFFMGVCALFAPDGFEVHSAREAILLRVVIWFRKEAGKQDDETA